MKFLISSNSLSWTPVNFSTSSEVDLSGVNFAWVLTNLVIWRWIVFSAFYSILSKWAVRSCKRLVRWRPSLLTSLAYCIDSLETPEREERRPERSESKNESSVSKSDSDESPFLLGGARAAKFLEVPCLINRFFESFVGIFRSAVE